MRAWLKCVATPQQRQEKKAAAAPVRPLAELDAAMDHGIHAQFAALPAMDCAANLKMLRRLLKTGLLQPGLVDARTFAKVLRLVLHMTVSNQVRKLRL